MEFYNVKTKTKVDVPEGQVRKQKVATKSGARYQLLAEDAGVKLFKFVSQATFNELNVPEAK